MDWGLEKDLLVPRNEQQGRMHAGRRYVVKVLLDRKTNRVFGSTRLARHCAKAPAALRAGQQVSLLIWQFSKLGTLAVVDNQYMGLIYHSDTFENLRIGSRRPGYIRKVRSDGKIDLDLKKPGAVSLSDSGRRIMEALEKAGGSLPCHDKSSPAEIAELFQMSKKEFKRAIGGLYKKRLIVIKDQGITLVDKKT
jgi:predicted RNA-binding protein (virulence factor B family)